MSYSHLTTFERARIEMLYEQGKPIRTIAEKLQRSASTISREIKLLLSYCSLAKQRRPGTAPLFRLTENICRTPVLARPVRRKCN